MRESKERRLSGKRMRFLAAAALSAALIGSQMPMVITAASRSTMIDEMKLSDLFPDNITVDEPMTLADIGLPEHKLGKLKWMDDSIELTKRVQSCEVIFIPDEGVDLTGMEDWDKEEGGVISHIHVIVSSIEENADDCLGDATLESSDSEMVEKSETEEESDLLIPEDGTEEENNGYDAETEAEDNSESEDVVNSDTENKEESEEEKENGTEKEANKEDNTEADTDMNEDSETSDNADSDNENDTEADLEDETSSNGDTESEGNAESEPEDEEASEETPADEETSDNIFDNPSDFTEEDGRPTEAPEDLTEEEKQIQAEINHKSEGISVSGINLPWYVQFRVTSGESYQFSNETDAMIFQSYEFELWDLQNNTEYEIPDGEYISVTVPVKEGYDYTIEHLLDNGATETIIPSVDGNIMVFSTHSFSPFGIAGSKQLVGPDFPIDDEVKPTPTVTPTPSVTGKPGDTSGNNTGNNTIGNNTSNPSNGNGNNSNSSTTGNGTDGSSNGVDDYNGNTDNNGSSIPDGSSGNYENTNNNNYTGGEDGSQSVNNGEAVATGDTTAILPFVVLILAAAVMIGAVIFIRKKK